MLRKYALFAASIALLFIASANARCVDIFYNPTCPHCEQELSFLYNISQKYNLTINQYDVLNQKVMPLFLNLSAYYNSSGDVPLTLVNNSAFVGFAYGNATQQVNQRLSMGFSNSILNAIVSSGNSCPTFFALSTIACKANSTSCATVITPSQARLKLQDSNEIEIFEIALLVIAIFAAVLVVLSIKRGHRA
ncbi:MAG: hypothetical protein QXR85_00030 [Candidatus Micrarchaeaceae archaeon]